MHLHIQSAVGKQLSINRIHRADLSQKSGQHFELKTAATRNHPGRHPHTCGAMLTSVLETGDADFFQFYILLLFLLWKIPKTNLATASLRDKHLLLYCQNRDLETDFSAHIYTDT